MEALLVAIVLVPVVCVAGGVAVALRWRRGLVRRGLRPTALRSAIAVFNGVAVALVAAVAATAPLMGVVIAASD